MFRDRWGLGVLCIVVALVWVLPAAAQFDRCLTSITELEYDKEFRGTVPAGFSTSTDNLFCFEGRKGDTVTLTATRIRGSGTIGVALISSSIPGYIVSNLLETDGSARVTYTLPENAAYNVSVSGDAMESIGYKLTMSKQTTRPAATPQPEATSTSRPTIVRPTEIPDDEAQESACQPQSFILIPGYSSGFELADEQPFAMYCFYGIEGNKYRITADKQSGDLDPLIYVFLARTEESVAFNNDQSLLNKNAQVDFVPEETGLYIVAVTRAEFGDGETEGEYLVEIENRTIRVPETCPEAFMIPPEGISIPEQDEGFYAFCFNGEDDQVVSLTAKAHRGDLDLDIYIAHPDLSPIETFRGTDDTLEATARINRDEPFLILIFDNTYEGGFDLTFEQD